MRIPFTKMQGAGNDFVVLDETRQRWGLKPAHYRFLGNRHFGVGADQILTVRPSPAPGIDFEYIIHNADGQEVEQCGNGARCFARFVYAQGLSDKQTLRVQTQKGVISPHLEANGNVRVDMGVPRFTPADVGLDATDLVWQAQAAWGQWLLPSPEVASDSSAPQALAIVSMGNPHAVLQVADVDQAPVGVWGPHIQRNARFTQGVNVGFMQVLDRRHIRLRVYERGVGETLACGTGACAAAVAGMRLGYLDAEVQVQTRGGMLTIAWAGMPSASQSPPPVYMSGPATIVFHGEIDLPDDWP